MAEVTSMGVTKWVGIQNGITAFSNISTGATAGVKIPTTQSRGEVSHLAVAKSNTCTLEVHVYANDVGQWLHADTVQFTQLHNEVALVRGISAFDRVQVSCNAIGSNTVNAYMGFSGG